jgi:hypothetical protein
MYNLSDDNFFLTILTLSLMPIAGVLYQHFYTKAGDTMHNGKVEKEHND